MNVIRFRSMILTAVCLAITGCAGPGHFAVLLSTCRNAGLCDPPPLDSANMDVVCDATLGSTCNAHSLDTVLDEVLPYASRRPGSRVRLWWLSGDVGTTEMLAELSVSSPQRSGAKAQDAQARRWTESARAYFDKAAEAALTRRPATRSPIAEAISKVTLSLGPHPAGRPTLIFVVSDGRQFSSLADFECGALPTPVEFRRRLDHDGLLEPHTLYGATVLFAFVTAGPLGGRPCGVEIRREMKIRELWESALTVAGTSRVAFYSAMPPLEQEIVAKGEK